MTVGTLIEIYIGIENFLLLEICFRGFFLVFKDLWEQGLYFVENLQEELVKYPKSKRNWI